MAGLLTSDPADPEPTPADPSPGSDERFSSGLPPLRALRAARDAVEYCFAQGWTDGLPVVPPLRALVEQFVGASNRQPHEVVMHQSGLGTSCTVERAAANAVMAGCLPERFPVVLAGLEALHRLTEGSGILQSTTGQAVLLVVNGPIRRALQLNAADNVLGGGVRANAAIGRAVRLCLINALSLRPGVFDRSTQGTPAKIGLCIAEHEEASPWEPLHVERGYRAQDSTVTAILIRGTMPVEHRTSRDPRHLLYNLSDAMSYAGAYFQLALAGAHLPSRGGHGSVVLLSPEHARVLADGGYSKQAVKTFLWEHFGKFVRERVRLGKHQGYDAEAEDVFAKFADAPDAITVVVTGAANAGISTICSTFVPRTVTVTCAVPHSGGRPCMNGTNSKEPVRMRRLAVSVMLLLSLVLPAL